MTRPRRAAQHRRRDAIDDARRLTEAEFGADAAFHLVIATAWAPDPHLVRDVAICSTAEI